MRIFYLFDLIHSDCLGRSYPDVPPGKLSGRLIQTLRTEIFTVAEILSIRNLIKGQVAVMIIILMKKPSLLFTVKGNVSGIKIQNQRLRRLFETT